MSKTNAGFNLQSTKKKPRGAPWPKGISQNPGGRPKEIIRPLIRELVQAKTEEAYDLAKRKLELTVGQATAAMFVRNALKKSERGDINAALALIDQCDGRPAPPGEEREPLHNVTLVITVQGPQTKIDEAATEISGRLLE